MALLQKAHRRFFVRHPLQLALAVLGIAIGVAAMVSVDLAVRSARTAFQESMTALLGPTTHQLVGAGRSIDETLYPLLHREFPEIPMMPRVEGTVNVGGETFSLRGFDVFASYPRHHGRTYAGLLPVLPDFLLQPGAVLVSAMSARQSGIASGAPRALQIGGRPMQMQILGTIEGDAPTDPALEGTLLADIATAQELLGKIGTLDRIDLVLPQDAGLEQRLRARLPVDVQLISSEVRTSDTARLSSAFETNLQAMSLLGLLVGLFLIYNTMTFAVLQRRELLASMRLLGVTRREILREVLGEALLLGTAGAVLGLLAGSAAAELMIDRVTQTINDVYYVLTVTQLTIDPSVLLRGFVLGVLTALGGAWLPAREAAGTHPLRSHSRSNLEANSRRWARRAAWFGAAMAAVSGPMILAFNPGLERGIGGLFLLLAGCGLMIPALIGILVRPISHLGSCRFRLAIGNVAASLSRTGIAISALAMAFAVALGIEVMTGSFRAAVQTWLEQLMQSDLYVSMQDDSAEGLDPGVLDRLARIPGVAGVSASRGILAESSLGQIDLLGLEPSDPARRAYRFQQGDAERGWSQFLSDDAVLISEPFANRHQLRIGEMLRLATPTGWVELPVAGVVYDYRSDRGIVLLRRDLYARHWLDERLTSVGLVLAQGASAAAVRSRVRAVPGLEQGVQIRSNREIREASLALFDRTFAVTGVLRLLAAAVALVGLVGSLLALHLERLREFVILRALGLTPQQLTALVLVQSGYIGLCAGLIALPLGVLLAWVLVRVIQLLSFGWTMDLAIPYSALWQTPAAACVGAVITGMFPAWRAGRSTPWSALRDE